MKRSVVAALAGLALALASAPAALGDDAAAEQYGPGTGVDICGLVGGAHASVLADCIEQDSAQLNEAGIVQAGLGTNVAVLQQGNQSIQQIGYRNRAMNVMRQVLRFRGGQLVSSTFRTRERRRSTPAPEGELGAESVPAGIAESAPGAAVCLTAVSEVVPATTGSCVQVNTQGNIVALEQVGDGLNLAAVQQANQSIQQFGVFNWARNVLRQVIVILPELPPGTVEEGVGGEDPELEAELDAEDAELDAAFDAEDAGPAAAVASDDGADGMMLVCDTSTFAGTVVVGACDQETLQLNEAALLQADGLLNLAAIQQGNQSIQQIGLYNEASNVVRRRVRIR